MRLAFFLVVGRALAAAERGTLLYGTTQLYDGYRGTSTQSALFCTEGELEAYYLAFGCEAYFPVLLYDGESLPLVAINESDRVLGPTGQLVSDNFTELLAGQLHQSLAEAFVFLEGDTYWTGSTAVGSSDATNCGSWSSASVTSQCNTGEFGSADYADSRWLAAGQGSCQFRRKLLCACANGTAITTDTPTASPSLAPVSARPSRSPSLSPSKKPSRSPSSSSPSRSPTHSPTRRPTGNPTHRPTTTSPTTASPTTASPTTASPTTASPTTHAPVTTSSPTTAAPTFAQAPLIGVYYELYPSPTPSAGNVGYSAPSNAFYCPTSGRFCTANSGVVINCVNSGETLGSKVDGVIAIPHTRLTVDSNLYIIADTWDDFLNNGPDYPLSTYPGFAGLSTTNAWGACEGGSPTSNPNTGKSYAGQDCSAWSTNAFSANGYYMCLGNAGLNFWTGTPSSSSTCLNEASCANNAAVLCVCEYSVS